MFLLHFEHNGFMITSYPIMIANVVTIIFALYILIIKIKLDVFPSKKNK